MSIERSPIKSKQGVRIVLLAVILLTMQAQIVFARKVAKPPPLEVVATQWTGFSTDETYLFRLVLSESEESSIGFIFTNGEPEVHRISTWRYEKGRINFACEGLANSMGLTRPPEGQVTFQTMTLDLVGKDWSRKIILINEPEFERRWMELRASMEQASRDANSP